MGRPLNHKFFGDLNANASQQTEQTGGEGAASVALSASTLAGMTPGTYNIPAAGIVAPSITGGKKPTLSLVVTSATAATVTVVAPGTGYTSGQTLTFSVAGSIASGSGSATATITLTASVPNAIAVQARFNGTNRTSGNDIIQQRGGKRFKVQTQDGTGVFTLVTRTPAAALEMAIEATDTGGATYWVRKITGRVCTLVNKSGSPLFADGIKVKWGLTASTGVVSITNA